MRHPQQQLGRVQTACVVDFVDFKTDNLRFAPIDRSNISVGDTVWFNYRATPSLGVIFKPVASKVVKLIDVLIRSGAF
jgi:hypothetical protein